MTRVIERYKSQDTWATTPVMENKSMDHLQKIIKTAGELEKPVDPDKLITRKFAEKAVETIKKRTTFLSAAPYLKTACWAPRCRDRI